MADFSKLVCLDLETSGSRPTRDRITEIGLVLIDDGVIVERWQSLVDPETSIPESIQRLNGITPGMLAGVPVFEQLFDKLQQKLSGRVIVAHNARFDMGFLRNAFQALGHDCRYASVCTVKLSRALYPEQSQHGLSHLIQRHHLSCHQRHRALSDANAVAEFVLMMQQQHGIDQIHALMQKQQRLASLPPHLSVETLDEIPNEPGIYRFYGDNDVLLYVGKSVTLRARVISHFSADHRDDREMKIAQQVKRVEWEVTAGEFSALLLEAEWVKKHSPLFNRQLRRHKELVTIYWQADSSSKPAIQTFSPKNIDEFEHCYGLFRSKRQATETLRSLVKKHQLCQKVSGLEKGKGACFAYQLKQCLGACCAKESQQQHAERMQTAFAPFQLQNWPYTGRIGIREYNPISQITTTHLLDRWCYLGKVHGEQDFSQSAELINTAEALFDMDIYRLCVDQLGKLKSDQLICSDEILNFQGVEDFPAFENNRDDLTLPKEDPLS